MTVTLGIGLAIALVLLLGIAVAADRVGRFGLARQQVVAALRAVAQLAVVSLVVTGAASSVWGAMGFALLMFGVAVYTTAKRTGAPAAWPWAALALASGVVPVEVAVFASGAAPFTGISIIALCGIVIGNAMTANTLVGRRSFAELRANTGTYEAMLSLGFERSPSVGLVLDPVLGEALVPNLDQTKTVGLVTLPGAFIGVLLGGGSPVQAGAAQILVLLGIMACQSVVVVVATRLMRAGRLLPPDLKAQLHA